MKRDRERLDVAMVNRGLSETRSRALGRIMAGEVRVDGERVTKAGAEVSRDASIRVEGKGTRYVSRGGVKLEAALRSFSLDVRGFHCLDVGASTGGFTDCLLQNGAARVTAVDVGYGQFHWKLRSDPRVTVLERTNIRRMDGSLVERAMDLICIDVSFISLRIVVPAVLSFLGPHGRLVCLIKPQFEVGKGRVGRGGVVRDPQVRTEVVEDLTAFFETQGLRRAGCIPSPILGPKGNQEYLILLKPVSGIIHARTSDDG